MQLPSILLPLSLLIGICFPNYLLAQNPSKTIKKETCWVYPIHNNAASATGYPSSITVYDKAGKKEKITTYNKAGNLLYEFYFDYNKDTQEMYWVDNQGKKRKSQTEIYSKTGAVLKTIRYDNEENQLDAYVFDYNNNQKTKEIYYNKDNSIVYSIDYYHNSIQKGIREAYIDHLANKQFSGATTLNDLALPIKYSQYSSSGRLEKSIDYQRDAQGRIISKKTNLENKQLEINEVYEYLEDSTKSFIYLGPDKNLVEYTVFTFEYY